MNTVFKKQNYRYAWYDKKAAGLICRACRDIKYAWQRIMRGYADCDIWSIDSWFLSVIPDMLLQLKDTRHGSPGILGENYTNEDGILVNDTCHGEWDAILSEMIWLFRESDESTCRKVNPYEEEHSRIFNEFEEKYGIFGQKLMTEEEKSISGDIRVHFARELPEYQEAEEFYFAEEKRLEEYREECKDKAFEMFSKWFWYLWD